jgi:hypothetical protein
MSKPEIITVNSESLEAEVRSLLPSQAGFGSELQASNVITPIIDLTPTASGSNLGVNIQTALNFGGATGFEVRNTETTVASSAGFYRIVGTMAALPSSSDRFSGAVRILQGGVGKNMWTVTTPSTASQGAMVVDLDLTIFLTPDDTLTVLSTDDAVIMAGSVRQVATVFGQLVNPVGFTLE